MGLITRWVCYLERILCLPNQRIQVGLFPLSCSYLDSFCADYPRIQLHTYYMCSYIYVWRVYVKGCGYGGGCGGVWPIVKSQKIHRKFENNAPPPLKKIGFRFWNAAVYFIYNPPPKYICLIFCLYMSSTVMLFSECFLSVDFKFYLSRNRHKMVIEIHNRIPIGLAIGFSIYQPDDENDFSLAILYLLILEIRLIY